MHPDRVDASETRIRLGKLLDRVERGATITIMRRGRPVATLSPAQPSRADVMRAMSNAARDPTRRP